MKITKTSLNLLKKHSRIWDRNHIPNKNYDYRMEIVAEGLIRAGIVEGNTKDGFALVEGEERIVFHTKNECEGRYFFGMCTRFPSLIHAARCYGVNEVHIYDANALIKSIANDRN